MLNCGECVLSVTIVHYVVVDRLAFVQRCDKTLRAMKSHVIAEMCLVF